MAQEKFEYDNYKEIYDFKDNIDKIKIIDGELDLFNNYVKYYEISTVVFINMKLFNFFRDNIDSFIFDIIREKNCDLIRINKDFKFYNDLMNLYIQNSLHKEFIISIVI